MFYVLYPRFTVGYLVIPVEIKKHPANKADSSVIRAIPKVTGRASPSKQVKTQKPGASFFQVTICMAFCG